MAHYREDYERVEVKFEADKGRTSSHWAKERNKWGDDVYWWQRFKEAQHIHNQKGRSELELDLDHTDTGLTEALSKLNDWQEFEIVHQERFHEAEAFHEECQQGFVGAQNAMVAATKADAIHKFQQPKSGWRMEMKEAQEELETWQGKLMWVKSEWTDVIAEACAMIAAVPKLQEQLEAKVEAQTKAIYRRLQQKGAHPSQDIHPPSHKSTFPERVQYWISASSALTAELWEWEKFMGWRSHVRDAGNTNQEGRKVLCEGDSYPELMEDLANWHQYELDKAESWSKCWRHQIKKHVEAKEKKSQFDWNWSFPAAVKDGREPDPMNYVADEWDATIYAKLAKEQVSVATQRLEHSIQKLHHVLGEFGPHSTCQIQVEKPEVETPPTPPESESPEILPQKGRPSKEIKSAEKRVRRENEEQASKGGATMGNASTEQLPFPSYPSDSNDTKKNEDTDMPDNVEAPVLFDNEEESKQPDPKDAAMSDTEELVPQNLPSPPIPSPTSTKNTNKGKRPPPTPAPPTSRKTQSATKFDQAKSGKILKNPGNNKPPKKPKAFTEEQTAILLYAAAASCPSTGPTAPRRSERLKEKAVGSRRRT